MGQVSALPAISKSSTIGNSRAGRDCGGTFTLAYGVVTDGRAPSVKTPITIRSKLLAAIMGERFICSILVESAIDICQVGVAAWVRG